MFDIGIGFSELLLLAVLTIIVVGPEDLPALLRTIGRYAGQVKRVADQFRREFDEALKETELDKLNKPVEAFGANPEPDLATQRAEALIDFDEHNRMILDKERLDLATQAAPHPLETATERALREAGVKGLDPCPEPPSAARKIAAVEQPAGQGGNSAVLSPHEEPEPLVKVGAAT